MVVPLNCLRLGDTFDDIIKVNVGDKLEDDNSVEIDISDATVSDLKTLIRHYPNKRPRLDFNSIPLDLERPPLSLLNTDGLSWDYQKSPKLEEELRVHVRNLYGVFKENKRDKSNTPIFFMVSGAGCGKSRNATEIPKILRRIFVNDPELGSRLQEALIFNIPLENETKINLSTETDANVLISKRMLYQLQDQLLWNEIRDDMQTLSITDVLKRCANQKNVALKELTVILIVDGLQTTLINENDGMDKRSLFYSFLTEISLIATNNKYPFVIACCTATLARPFHQMVADSHQKRVFLPIRSLNPPQKKGKPVFKDAPLLNMLISDMGGNGRALEALESALIDVDIENDSFVSIAEKVCYKLEDRYNEWINKTHYLIPVLRVILTHTTLIASVPIPGTNILPEELSKLGLIKFEKQNEFSGEGTLTCPYIWLWLMANASKSDSILRNWNFKYYKELQTDGDPTIPPGCQFWQHFEHFIASFRVLKSNVFEIDKEIKLQDIHAGAKHNFGTATIKNIPLSLAKATRQQSTKSSAYSANKTVTCKRGDDQINLNLEDASACIINGSSAPAGDSFCPIYFANTPQLHIESHQCKCLKSTTVNQTTFHEEREKACDKDDIFILYTCGSSNVTRLPPLSAIVDCDRWKLYFGPFAGRAFLLVQSDKFNINNCSKSELTSICGIGPKRADLLESMRPYDDLEDCIYKTKIPRKFLINFRFG
ncbi:10780_t:CDS:2 [Funneliformis caledonium]|uniref:10780_t:CDS:1 n=1 Tax=Funneliformis caledonium TaxID=1117310 RepID=A0A9N9H9K6_9GLOM|nr:10780_t:CDS:2 [Funneliformis caledonium]